MRRIAPALYFVMLVCIPVALFLLAPGDMKDFSQSLVAVPLISSNMLFWHENGYFSAATELKPLIHTWSLAVEQQYYLLFPALLMLLFKYRYKYLVISVSAICAFSFFLAIFSVGDYPEASFFFLVTRGWEILLGAIVGLILFKRPNLTGNTALSLIGLVLILYATLCFSKETEYPSVSTLAPTVGAALVILFASGNNLTCRLLSMRVLVGVGVISYSLYLWHQPILAFYRHFSVNFISSFEMLLLICVSFLFAVVSWRFVEQPFRKADFLRSGTLWRLFAGCSAGFVAIGLAGQFSNGFEVRFSDSVLEVIQPPSTDYHCTNHAILDSGMGYCEFGDTASYRSIILYGASHARALQDALGTYFLAKHIKGILVTRTQKSGANCEPIVGLVTSSTVPQMTAALAICERQFTDVMEILKSSDGVIVSTRWTMNLFPIAGQIDMRPFDNGEGGVEFEGGAARLARNDDGAFVPDGFGKRRAILAMLDRFRSAGQPVIVVYPVPEVGWDVPRTVFKLINRDDITPDSTISTSHARFRERNRFIDGVLDSIARDQYFWVKPESILCDTIVPERCVAFSGGKALYHDDDHLSNYGASFIVKEIGVALESSGISSGQY